MGHWGSTYRGGGEILNKLPEGDAKNSGPVAKGEGSKNFGLVQKGAKKF